MKNCLVCGVEFEPKNPKGVYCSTKCRMKGMRKKKAFKPLILIGKDAIPVEKLKEIYDAPITKKEMPKGLSLNQQIQWKIDNL